MLDGISNELKEIDTIDCVGVTFESGLIKETKIYRYEKREKKNAAIEDYAIVESKTDSRRYYRIVPKENINYPEVIKEFLIKEKLCDDIGIPIVKLCEMSSKEKNATRIRLSQVGIQSGCFREKIVKSYFSIRKFKSLSDIRGVKQSFKEIADIIAEIKICCSLSDDYCSFLNENSPIFENSGYYASLIGINQKEGLLEFKVYYELFSPDEYFDEIEKHTSDVIDYICTIYSIPKEESRKVNLFFLQKGYFLRGFAISNNYGNDKDVLLRMYFAPVQRFL